MDSKAHLALMAKAQKVFGTDDSYLAFPVTPIVYDRSDLDFDLSSSGGAQEIIAKRENIEAFSLLVNLIPEGNAWIPSESRFLWDEYGHVLSQGSCASSTRSAEEEVQYQAARDFLKDTDADGIDRDSPQVALYKQYEDAMSSVRKEFDEARFSEAGEFSDDEAVRNQWAEVDEPAFRARLAEIERDWVLEGYKNEVDKQEKILIILGAKSPLTTWLDWKASFDPSINVQTGASSQLEVFPTTFSPVNALEDGNWKSFQLDRPTIEALVDQAPTELKKRFDVGSEKTTIDSMNLEFSMGVLNRHWFNRDVLHSRFWKLTDNTKVLSDGGSPSDGDCPAYVTGVVFARHITVKKKAKGQSGGSSNGRTTIISPTGEILEFSQLVSGKPLVTRIDPTLLQTMQPVRFKQRTQPRTRGVRPEAATMTKPMLVRQTMTARPVATQRLESTTIATTPRNTMGQIRLPPKLQLRPNPVAMKQLIMQRNYTRLEIAKPKPRTGSRPPPPPPPPESNPDEIQILAFICKRVPKCPNPDPSLAW